MLTPKREYVLDWLNESSILADYKLFKGKNAFVQKEKSHTFHIELYFHKSASDDYDVFYRSVQPKWFVIYPKVTKWFEEFYLGSTIRDLRNYSTQILFYQNVVDDYLNNLFGIPMIGRNKDELNFQLQRLLDS